MHVAICIVGYRNTDDVVRCLGALASSTHREFEVRICENGGAEARAALVRALPDRLPGGQPVRIAANTTNLGYAGGINACMRETAAADGWWILNPDTEPRPNALAELVARLSGGDCEAVGGRLCRWDGTIQADGGRWRHWYARAESLGQGRPAAGRPAPGDVEARQTYLNGAAMLVSRRFVEATGPMREDYFLYCEDVEWGLRARAAGMRLGFAPRARIFHRQGSSTGSGEPPGARPRLPIYLDERNKMLLTRDRFPRHLAAAAGAALVLLLLRYGRKGAWRQIGYAASGWYAGLRGERGAPDWAKD